MCERRVSNLGLSVSRALALNDNPRPRPSPHSKFFQKLPFTSKHYSIKNFTVDDIFLVGSDAFFFFSSTSLLLPTHHPPPSCTQAQPFNPMDCSPPGSSVMDFSRQEYQSGLPFPSPGSDAFMYH